MNTYKREAINILKPVSHDVIFRASLFVPASHCTSEKSCSQRVARAALMTLHDRMNAIFRDRDLDKELT